MSPEYGATCGFFPVDEETLELPAPDRPQRRAGRARRGVLQGERALARPGRAARRTRRSSSSTSPTVEPSLAGPRRPQDRVPLREREAVVPRGARHLRRRRTTNGSSTRPSPRRSRRATRPTEQAPGGEPEPEPDPMPGRASARREPPRRVRVDGERVRARPRRGRDRRDHVLHEHVEPAGDDRRRPAREEGGRARPAPQAWVKSSLAPGSKVVTEYYERAGLTPYLDALGFHTVGYGCTTCIGNSGPLPRRDLRRDRRGRPRRLRRALRQPQLRGAHPPGGEGELPRLAAARRRLRARRADGHRPRDRAARPGHATATTSSCATSGRRRPRSQATIAAAVDGEMFRATYADVFTGDERGASCRCPRASSSPGRTTRPTCAGRRTSTGMPPEPGAVADIAGARCLVMLGDSVTTDHISPAGSIKPDSPGRPLPRRARRRARRTSTRTARAAATTR